MSDDPWNHLAAILEAENAALARLDLACAGGMVEAKEAALAATRGAAPPAPQHLAELAELARTNQRLLERGLAIQARVLALVATAAREALARETPAPGYGDGAREMASPPLALCRSA